MIFLIRILLLMVQENEWAGDKTIKEQRSAEKWAFRESRLGTCHFGISHFGNSIFQRPMYRASLCKNWKVTWLDRNPGMSGDVDWSGERWAE